MKHAALNKIGVANWAPNNHSSRITLTLDKMIFQIRTKSKLNIGEYVFDQTVKHADSFTVKLPIIIPYLIIVIILKQHPEVSHPQETPRKKTGPLNLDRKMFVRTHGPYIMVKHQGQTVGENSSYLSKATKKDVLYELMEVSKDLQATISASTTKKKKVDELTNLMTNEKEGEDEEEVDSEKEESGSEEDEFGSEEDEDNSEVKQNILMLERI